MIIDCFPFFNEFDLLEIRLNELADVVDMFVLTEATLTHRGNEKPLYFDENKDGFSGFNIKHIIVDDYTGIDTSYSWDIERYQRQCGVDFVKSMGLTSEDVVLISDCDEIFRAEKVKESAMTTGWGCAGAFMLMFYYYMNCFLVSKTWCPARWIKGDRLENYPPRGGYYDGVFTNAGWHFSYLGDIKEKLASFAHWEYDKPPYNTTEYIEQKKSRCENLFDDEYRFGVVQDLSYLPDYVLENRDKFSGYIRP